MIKTNEHNVSFNDLTVDTAGLQALTHAGIKTATEMTQRKIAFSASSHLSIKMLPENIIKSIC